MALPDFLNVIDLIALAFILLSALRGYICGLSGEIARLAGMVAAFVVGVVTYNPAAAWLSANSSLEERSASALAFAAITLISIMVMFVLRYICSRVMRLVIDDAFDKKAGVLAGLVHSALFVFMVFVAMNMWPNERMNRMFGQESAIGRATLLMMPVLQVQIEKTVGDVQD